MHHKTTPAPFEITEPTSRGRLFAQVLTALLRAAPSPVERLVLPFDLFHEMGLPDAIGPIPAKQCLVELDGTLIEIKLRGHGKSVLIDAATPASELASMAANPSGFAMIWAAFVNSDQRRDSGSN